MKGDKNERIKRLVCAMAADVKGIQHGDFR
jgi:hypothetical protein